MSLLDPEYADMLGNDPAAQFSAQRIPLDLQHHDMPERHTIGTTLFAPGPPKGVGTVSPGKSLAPAREDHVHGLDSVNFPGPLGRIAVGAAAANPVVIANGTTAALTNTISFTLLANRRYRAVFISRALGPSTIGQQVVCPIRGVGSLAVFDHWYEGITQWGNLNISQVIAAGTAGSLSMTIQAQNPNVSFTVFPTEYYIEDIGLI